MTQPGLRIKTIGQTTVITLNNPPANTWTPESLYALKETIEELNNTPENIALILASESTKFFSAGADLSRFNHDNKNESEMFANAFGEAFETLTNYRGVSIAAITGFAMGGGLEAALCCDIRIAETQSQMALPEASVGLLPCGLGTQHLPWLVGEAWAKRMILLGERVDADKALQIGLIQEVVETGSALNFAIKLAEKASLQSPTAINFCKTLIMSARQSPMSALPSQERELFVKLWDDKNQREGVSAFLEKRNPQWSNTNKLSP